MPEAAYPAGCYLDLLRSHRGLQMNIRLLPIACSIIVIGLLAYFFGHFTLPTILVGLAIGVAVVVILVLRSKRPD